jgi:hypothetical protein
MGYAPNYTGTVPYGYGMMWRGQHMLDYSQNYSDTLPYGFGPGWMHGMMDGGFGPGMMGGGSSPLLNPEPLSIAAASEAVNNYLAGLDNNNLVLGEVMIFENHAYAEIIEKDTGIGAMEVLVDPVTKAIYPEMGPNMMWNLKYGMMAGYGVADVSADMPVSPEEARQAAQSYLDTYLNNNLQVEEKADPFYGYYTFHISRDGKTIGMLSVNGYSQQVFLHTWHGDFIEMSGE